ncbi:hypothetical protein [Yeguia hominis]|uniref:Uncharacterized protein n=1 Tax=Yeguia hominis TaxID=2763662 RepID=A0A926DBB8_9FIRM|nr:hypothetical protein [Yeguia hominis]MBC8534727.1 hypothetical protein [Yeguia hominis]
MLKFDLLDFRTGYSRPFTFIDRCAIIRSTSVLPGILSGAHAAFQMQFAEKSGGSPNLNRSGLIFDCNLRRKKSEVLFHEI